MILTKFIKISLLVFLSIYVLFNVLSQGWNLISVPLEIIPIGGGWNPGFKFLDVIGEAVKIESKGPPEKDNISFLTTIILIIFFFLFFYIKDRERKREKKEREEELKLTRQRIKLKIEENI